MVLKAILDAQLSLTDRQDFDRIQARLDTVEPSGQWWLVALCVEAFFGWSEYAENLVDQAWEYEEHFPDLLFEFETQLRAWLGHEAPVMRRAQLAPAPIEPRLEGWLFECRDIGLEIVDPSLGDIREQLEDAAAGFHQLCGIRRSDRSVEFLDSATDLDGEGHLIALGTADMVYDAVPLEIETTMWVFERYVEGDVQAILDTLTWAHSAAIDPSRSPSAAPKSPANRRTVHHDKQSTAKSPADIEISKLKRRGFFKGR